MPVYKEFTERLLNSGIIDLNGNWIDLQDYGWKMLKNPSKENEEALRKWGVEQRKNLDKNSEDICVQIIVHN